MDVAAAFQSRKEDRLESEERIEEILAKTPEEINRMMEGITHTRTKDGRPSTLLLSRGSSKTKKANQSPVREPSTSRKASGKLGPCRLLATALPSA